MPFEPVAGKFCKITVTNAVPETPVTADIPGVNWTLDDDAKEQDTSNFLVGRHRIESLADVVATFSLIWDQADQPIDAAAANIRRGAELTIKFYVDRGRTRFYSGKFLVTKASPKVGGQEDKLMLDVTAGILGDLTYPVATPA
jgi:hypothetical protein